MAEELATLALEALLCCMMMQEFLLELGITSSVMNAAVTND
jgi:hypothetical protein